MKAFKKSKKFITASILISASAILALLLYLLFTIFLDKDNLDSENNEEVPNLLFGNNYISYVLNNEIVSINILGAKNSNVDLTDTVVDMKLNNEKIEIIDYEIDSGNINNEPHLFNFMLDIQVSGTALEQADTLQVFFNNGDSKEYNIGQITVTNEINSSQHLDFGKEYTVGYGEPSLYANVLNTSDNLVQLQSISDLNNVLSFQYEDELIIEPGKWSIIDIKDLTSEHSSRYDFFTITPIINYKMDNKNYNFDLPPVIFGLLSEDDVKLEKILEAYQ